MLRFSEQEIRFNPVLTTCLTPSPTSSPPIVRGPWNDCEAQSNVPTQTPLLPLPERLVFSPVLLLHQPCRLSISPALLLILNLCQRRACLTKKRGKRWGRKPVSHSLLPLPLLWRFCCPFRGLLQESLRDFQHPLLLSYCLAFTSCKRKTDRVTSVIPRCIVLRRKV